MNWNIEAMITGAISGGAIGAMASLLSPWSTWGVEKKRLQREDRKSRIYAWRQMVSAARHSSEVVTERYEPFRVCLRKAAGYRNLRAFLSPHLASEIETDFPDNRVDTEGELRDLILDRIHEIEHEWGLI